MTVDLAIRGGEVWSGAGSERLDLLINDGVIVARVAAGESGDGDLGEGARRTIDASGLAVLPGVTLDVKKKKNEFRENCERIK